MFFWYNKSVVENFTYILCYSRLFWTDYGSQRKLERSSLHGTERTTIMSTGLTTPKFITIDHSTDTIYWVDTGRSLIGSCDMDGGNKKSFIQSSFLSSLAGFTLYQVNTMGLAYNPFHTIRIRLRLCQIILTAHLGIWGKSCLK